MSNSIGNSSLSSELLLNKIMNGSVKTESGRTVTMGNRVTSSQLNLDAIAPSISSANVKVGAAQATAMQGRLSEMKDYLENLKKEVNTATNETATSLIANAATYVNKVATSEVDGIAVFNDASISVDMGFGNATAGETLELGANEVGASMTTLGTEIAKLPPTPADVDDTKLKAWQEATSTAIDTALNSVYDAMGASTQDIRVLNSRSAILDSIAETYVDAAASQSVVSVGGADNLLAGVIG